MDYVHLGFLARGGGEEVLGVPQLMVSTGQVLVETLHGLSIVELSHSYPPNNFRHREPRAVPLPSPPRASEGL